MRTGAVSAALLLVSALPCAAAKKDTQRAPVRTLDQHYNRLATQTVDDDEKPVAPKTTRDGKPASPGYRLFWLAAHVGKKITGDAAYDKELKRPRPYYQADPVKVALDASRCEVVFSTHDSARLRALSWAGPVPLAVVDKGCTGTVATSTFEWPDQQEEPMTQRRLDDVYEAMYEDLEAKSRRSGK